jgi:4-amino-4-deoxy-L-arabinose transferase-like glycosyltransferase
VSARRFWAWLAAIVAVGLGLRLLYAFGAVGQLTGDPEWYHRVANGIADGDGFRNPYQGWKTAFHPPLFPAALAALSKLGATGLDAHQAAGSAMGAAGVGAIGMLGRQLAGELAGLLAAALAAVYLPLIALDSVLQTESLLVLLAPIVLLLALRLREEGGWLRAAALGVAIGLAALTRAESLALIPVLALPLSVSLPDRRLRTFAVVCLATALTVAPWSLRNSLHWDEPVGISTTDGSVIVGANCPTTYSGPMLARWDFNCLRRGVRTGLTPDEPEVSARWREEGLEYAGDNMGRVPVVLAVRVLRTWNLYDPAGQARIEAALVDTSLWLQWLMMASGWLLTALAIAGALSLRGRRAELIVMLAPVAAAVLTALIAYGQPRFRALADVALVTLAGVALAAWASRLSARRRGPVEPEASR